MSNQPKSKKNFLQFQSSSNFCHLEICSNKGNISRFYCIPFKSYSRL